MTNLKYGVHEFIPWTFNKQPTTESPYLPTDTIKNGYFALHIYMHNSKSVSCGAGTTSDEPTPGTRLT
jgi:hypothetical protein